MRKNPLKPVLALSFVSAVALLILSLQPLFIGSLKSAYGFSEIELGYFASAPIAASFLVFVSAPFWVDHVSVRGAILWGSVIAIFSLAAMALSSELWSLTTFFSLYAVGISIVQVPALIALGRMPDAEASFGIYTAASVLLAGICAFFIPAVIEPAFGFNGFVSMMLVATAVSVAVVLCFAEASLEGGNASEDEAKGGRNTTRGWLTLASLAAFYMGILAAWPFLELVGSEAGLDGQTIGVAFASGFLISGIAPLIAAKYGDRIPLAVSMGATAAMFVSFAWLLSAFTISPLTFGLALILFLIAWNFGIPYMLAVAAHVDDGGRAMALAPAAIAFGAAFGPAFGGYALTGLGPVGLFAAFGVIELVSMALILWADRPVQNRKDHTTVSPIA
ncbi:MAG: MFS transporter [Pseudomonadota bacterium]